jgi:hypothetical protein
MFGLGIEYVEGGGGGALIVYNANSIVFNNELITG